MASELIGRLVQNLPQLTKDISRVTAGAGLVAQHIPEVSGLARWVPKPPVAPPSSPSASATSVSPSSEHAFASSSPETVAPVAPLVESAPPPPTPTSSFVTTATATPPPPTPPPTGPQTSTLLSQPGPVSSLKSFAFHHTEHPIATITSTSTPAPFSAFPSPTTTTTIPPPATTSTTTMAAAETIPTPKPTIATSTSTPSSEDVLLNDSATLNFSDKEVGASDNKYVPRTRSVPSTSLGRAFGFAGLAMGLAVGTIQSTAKKTLSNVMGDSKGSGNSNSSASSAASAMGGGDMVSAVLSEKNVERIASTLCRMRGAALKLGQMLSIQDESMVPPQLLAVLNRVRSNADIMPQRQLHRVLSAEWGSDWRKHFLEFSDVPFASASIGQVHRATLATGEMVAVKVQYPGVAESIDSDLANLKMIASMTNLIPKALYIDRIMKVVKEELARECNYVQEAENTLRTRELLANDPDFMVPKLYQNLCTRRILTSEFIHGIHIDKTFNFPQHIRNRIASIVLRLTVRELFEFRFMQTDPNFSNFLFPSLEMTAESGDQRLRLIDFGASLDFPDEFVDSYLKMVVACANQDVDGIIQHSLKLGFLTGDESRAMVDAHVKASMVVGEPFADDAPFDFANANLTARIKALATTMLEHRLAPPPPQVYSLHRKLSGCFLLCIKLRAVIPCRHMLLDTQKTCIENAKMRAKQHEDREKEKSNQQ